MIQGSPANLISNPSLVKVKSDLTALVPPILICAVDVSGNPTLPNSALEVSVVSSDFALGGTTSESISTADPCVSFSNVQISSPAAGVLYKLTFTSTLGTYSRRPWTFLLTHCVSVDLEVIEGDPSSISFIILPSARNAPRERFETQPGCYKFARGVTLL